jgi:hypothetical protein
MQTNAGTSQTLEHLKRWNISNAGTSQTLEHLKHWNVSALCTLPALVLQAAI